MSTRQEGWKRLAQIDEPAATETFLNLLEAHGDEAAPEAPLRFLKSRHPETVFPRLLTFTRFEALASEVYKVALRFCEAGLLTDAFRAQQIRPLRTAYRRERDWLRRQVHDQGNASMWEGPYLEHQSRASTLLALFQCFEPRAVERDLREATRERDPMVASSATATLLRHGQHVPEGILRRVASNPLTHSALHRVMKQTGTLDRFPRSSATPSAFAEARLVGWLTRPTELGRIPDLLELEAVWTRAALGFPDDGREYYVFRFRTHAPHWAAKHGWLSAVVGPYSPSDGPYEGDPHIDAPFITFGGPMEGLAPARVISLHTPWTTQRTFTLSKLAEQPSNETPD